MYTINVVLTSGKIITLTKQSAEIVKTFKEAMHRESGVLEVTGNGELFSFKTATISSLIVQKGDS